MSHRGESKAWVAVALILLGFVPMRTEVRAQTTRLRENHTPAFSLPRGPAAYWDWGGRSALAAVEIAQTEAVLDRLDIRSPDRPLLLARQGEDYVALKIHALRQGRAITTWGLDPVTHARQGAIAYWNVLIQEYSGVPSTTFPRDPPAAYGHLDAIYGWLAYEYEDAGAFADARRAYLDLISKFPGSQLVTIAYFALGEIAFAEGAEDQGKWAEARQAYLKVIAGPRSQEIEHLTTYCYAHYKLAYAAWNQGDRRTALDTFNKTIACARTSSVATPWITKLAEESRKQVLAIARP